MRNRVLAILIGVLVVLLIVVPVLAAASATITILESSGSSYDMVGATASMDNVYLAAHGFISTTGLDVDINSLPFMLADDRTVVATPLAANGTVLLPYTTGNTLASAFHILTGRSGYITIPDAAALELANNFEIELDGYINTSSGSSKNLIYKGDAFVTYVSASGEITSDIIGDVDGNLLPEADGNYTQWTANTGTRWDAVNDPVGAPDDDATYVYSTTSSGNKVSFGFEDLPEGVEYVSNVRIYARLRNTGGTNAVIVFYRESSTDYNGTAVALSEEYTTYSQPGWSYSLNPATSLAWTPSEVNSMEWGMIYNGAGSFPHRLTQMYAVVTYSAEVASVTATGVSSESHMVKTGSATGYLYDQQDSGYYGGDLYGDDLRGQTFTTGGADVYYLNEVTWRFKRGGSPADTLVVALRATSGGSPTGTDLASASLATSSISTVSDTWYTFDFGYMLSPNTQYALLAYLLGEGGSGSDFIQMTRSNTDLVSGGNYVQSLNGGSSWTSDVDSDVRMTASESTLFISIDGSIEDIGLTASVPDNSNNWTIADNSTIDFLPYMDFYKHTVSSTLIAHYQPIAIIANTGAAETADAGSSDVKIIDAALTQANDYWNLARLIITDTTDDLAPKGETAVITDFLAATDELQFAALTAAIEAGDTYTIDFGTLPDREGTAQNGIITWGINPTGMTVSIGALLPSVVVTPAENVADVPDLVPEFNPNVSSGVEGEAFPFYGLFKGLMDDYYEVGGPNITMPYFWKIVATIIAFTVGTGVLLASRNLLVGIGAYALLIAVPTAMGILDWYFIVWYVIGAVAVSLLVTKWTSSSI